MYEHALVCRLLLVVTLILEPAIHHVRLLFIMSACLAYYEQRTRVEEKLMEENFGELYTSYKEKTRHKFLPWVY